MAASGSGGLRVVVVGLGFVGLTTGLCLAEQGCRVWGLDRDAGRLEAIRRGRPPFHEPGLAEALARHFGTNFHLADNSDEVLADADLAILCVGTPTGTDGAADLSTLLDAVATVAARFPKERRYPVIMVKSTVPPGSTAGPIRQAVESSGRRVGEDIGLAVVPEFLREGRAWEDATDPDRIVVGTVDHRAGEVMEKLYDGYSDRLRLVPATEAEFVKYLSNALLATLISFSNEQAMLAERIGGIDVARAFRLLHEDRRWSGRPAAMTSYVFPGCGFGGYCLPKDTAALARTTTEHGLSGTLLNAVMETNRRARTAAAERIAAAARAGETVGVLGLSFKPGSDDVRDSPAADIVGQLVAMGLTGILAHDPMAMTDYAAVYGHPIRYAAGAEEVVRESAVVAILTAWPEYRTLDFSGVKVIDCRYCLSDAPEKRRRNTGE